MVTWWDVEASTSEPKSIVEWVPESQEQSDSQSDRGDQGALQGGDGEEGGVTVTELGSTQEVAVRSSDITEEGVERIDDLPDYSG